MLIESHERQVTDPSGWRGLLRTFCSRDFGRNETLASVEEGKKQESTAGMGAILRTRGAGDFPPKWLVNKKREELEGKFPGAPIDGLPA